MITSLYAGILACLFFKLSLDTIAARRKHQISLGHGPNNEIAAIVSAHANFAAYVPLLVLLLFSVESAEAIDAMVLHFIGVMAVTGRLLHYLAFRAEKMQFKARVAGMHLTLWPLLILAGLNIWCYFAAVFRTI